MNDQLSLISIPIAASREENSNRSLLELIQKMERDELLIPEFQRAPNRWGYRKQCDWCESLIKNKSVGIILTYQIVQPDFISSSYLADGLQRLTTTIEFLKNPTYFLSGISLSDAQKAVRNFQIDVQHRHYLNHIEAMYAFQNLNRGSALTAAEFFAGELKLSSLGKLVYESVPQIVARAEYSLLTSYKRGAQRESIFLRNAFALYLQYISGTTQIDFWRITSDSNQHSENHIVEKQLRRLLDEAIKTEAKLRESLQYFEQMLAEQVSEIRTLAAECGQPQKPFSFTMLNWLLHVAIWRRNTQRPFGLYQELVRQILKCLERHPTFESRWEMPDGKSITLSVGSLTHLPYICNAFGNKLMEPRKRQRGSTQPGYNLSHIKPFNAEGNGDTIIESAPRNKSRQDGLFPLI